MKYIIQPQKFQKSKLAYNSEHNYTVSKQPEQHKHSLLKHSKQKT